MGVHIEEAVDTRARLLEAAGEVFAERGFEKATVRQIVQRAGANLNAVNYYFRDKRSLYHAVFECAHDVATEGYVAERARRHALPPAEHLRAFIASMLAGLLVGHTRVWPRRLIYREMIDPTGALDIVIERVIRPRFEEATEIVRRLLGGEIPQLRVQLCAESVVAQCVHIAHAQPVLSRLMPELKFGVESIEFLVDHITAFSLAALGHARSEEATA